MKNTKREIQNLKMAIDDARATLADSDPKKAKQILSDIETMKSRLRALLESDA